MKPFSCYFSSGVALIEKKRQSWGGGGLTYQRGVGGTKKYNYDFHTGGGRHYDGDKSHRLLTAKFCLNLYTIGLRENFN